MFFLPLCYLISNLLRGETVQIKPQPLNLPSRCFLFSFLEGKLALLHDPAVLHPVLSAGCGGPTAVSDPSGTELEDAGAVEFTPGAFQLSWLVYTAHRAPAGWQVLNLLTSQRDKQTVEFAIPPSK